MTTTSAAVHSYRAEFERLDEALFRHQPEEIRSLRLKAMESFQALGWPHKRMEDWRHTSLTALAATEFRAPPASGTVDQDLLAWTSPADQPRAVIAAGRYAAEWSSLGHLPEGVEVHSLAAALADFPHQVLPYLGQQARFDAQALVALNTALFRDGILIRVAPGVVARQTIHLLYVTPPEAAQAATYPRTLVLAGESSEVTIVEHYVGTAAGPTFTNAVTEIVADAGALVDHLRLVREPSDTSHLSTVQTVQAADSRLGLHAFIFGGGLVRNEVNATLNGAGAEVVMNGLYLAKGRQHVDNHTRIDHVAPNCSSMENYKGILDGRAHGVFNGRIVVHSGAQKTSAAQVNKNLMLSDRALINTNPQLEIYADDVKCTHGSTVGQVDEDAMFYFLSRGIDRKLARMLLIQGFADEIIAGVKDEAFRSQLQGLATQWLSTANRAS